jgi:hypothetical protein
VGVSGNDGGPSWLLLLKSTGSSELLLTRFPFVWLRVAVIDAPGLAPMRLVIWSKPSRMNDREYPARNTGSLLRMACNTPPSIAGLHATPALGAKLL